CHLAGEGPRQRGRRHLEARGRRPRGDRPDRPAARPLTPRRGSATSGGSAESRGKRRRCMEKTWVGSCHCGKVRYEVALDLKSAVSCNCSMCLRAGTLLAFVPTEKFVL